MLTGVGKYLSRGGEKKKIIKKQYYPRITKVLKRRKLHGKNLH